MSDAAKLREAIEDARKRLDTGDYIAQIVYAPNLRLLADAAEKHLATLPRTKPMWFVIWGNGKDFYANQYPTETRAAGDADRLKSMGYGVIATVGPYEVPDVSP